MRCRFCSQFANHEFDGHGYCGLHYQELIEHCADVKLDLVRLSELVEAGHAFEKYEVQINHADGGIVRHRNVLAKIRAIARNAQ